MLHRTNREAAAGKGSTLTLTLTLTSSALGPFRSGFDLCIGRLQGKQVSRCGGPCQKSIDVRQAPLSPAILVRTTT